MVAGFFASQTLDAVLGASREAMAARLRAAIQRDLVAMDSGIDLVAVAIEAVHPPAGAAEAYHNVQAAQIQAETSISAERGRAASTHAGALQYTSEAIAQARAAAAETVGAAQVGLTLFTADQLAAAAGGDSFLLERYFTGLVAALPKIPVTIIDNRIPAPDMPVLDLRPPGAASTPSVGQNQE